MFLVYCLTRTSSASVPVNCLKAIYAQSSERISSYKALGARRVRVCVRDSLRWCVQGADVEILKGAGHWLRLKVVCVTAEAHVSSYEDGHTAQELMAYMLSQGFRQWGEHASDYLFVNSALEGWLPLVDCFTQGL